MTIRVFYARLGTSSVTYAFDEYKNVLNWDTSANILTLVRKSGNIYVPLAAITSFRQVL